MSEDNAIKADEPLEMHLYVPEEQPNNSFKPVIDITTHELALILSKIDLKISDALLKELPASVQRHFLG